MIATTSLVFKYGCCKFPYNSGRFSKNRPKVNVNFFLFLNIFSEFFLNVSTFVFREYFQIFSGLHLSKKLNFFIYPFQKSLCVYVVCRFFWVTLFCFGSFCYLFLQRLTRNTCPRWSKVLWKRGKADGKSRTSLRKFGCSSCPF